jgi:formylmethanofuran dehydrogenase subunit C
MALNLRWNGITTLSVEGVALNPETLASLSPAEVSRLPIPVGNTTAEIGDVFTVTPSSAADGPDVLVLEGDLRRVYGIGRDMSRGSIVIHGDVGPYLGVSMTGGSVEVHGDAAAWAGAENQGGRIEIRGNAGRFLGASLPGSRLGMREGRILVHGSAGDVVGRHMRRGLIAVGGDVGDDFGKGMIAGSAFVLGKLAGIPARG